MKEIVLQLILELEAKKKEAKIDPSHISGSEINQAIKNKEVKAHVRETWHDTHQDQLWVWVYPVN